MIPRTPAHWKRKQPTSLRHAMELCKQHALAVRHLSVEGIAEQAGITDHWALYKYLQSGRMPLCLVRPFETACGADYITRWMAASAGLLAVDMPTGRATNQVAMVELNSGFAQALQLLTDFYKHGSGDSAATLEALRTHLEQVAFHHKNVAAYAAPELEF